MSSRAFNSRVVYQISKDHYKQYLKSEYYDNSHYSYFEKNQGAADQYQPDIEPQRVENLLANAQNINIGNDSESDISHDSEVEAFT